jgi:hypothetical protein
MLSRVAFDGSISLTVLLFFLYLVSNMHGMFPLPPQFSVAVARIAYYGSSGTHWGYQVAARIFTPSFPIPLPLHRTQRPARM